MGRTTIWHARAHFPGSRSVLIDSNGTTPADRAQAERHGSDRTRREHPMHIADYDTAAPTFNPALPRSGHPTTAASRPNGLPGSGLQEPSLLQTTQMSSTPISSRGHDVASPGASSPAGSYLSTILSPSASSDEMDIDSRMTAEWNTPTEQATSRPEPLLGSRSREKQSKRPV